jgi:PhnB protein
METDFNNKNWFENVENRTHPWPGLNWLTAMLYVSDVQKALDFYSKTFNFVPIFQVPGSDGKTIEFARLRYRGSNFTLSKEGAFNYEGKAPSTTKTLPPCMFYVYVDDVDYSTELAFKSGCQLLEPAHEEFWGDRKSRILDPFGYVWELATRMK